MGHVYAKAADSIYKTFFSNPNKLFFLRSSSLRQKMEDNRWILNRFRFFFTFVIRITFLTNREVPRRIRERDLVQATPISVMFKSNSTQSKYLIKSLHHLKWQLLVCRKIVWPNMYIIIYFILIFLHTSLPEL